jgi:hypothetical protein
MLAEYDQHGRILDGTRKQMTTVAVSRWLTTCPARTPCCWLPPTPRPPSLPGGARNELVPLGLVATSGLIELADGNVAGPGDLITAQQNARIEAGEAGRRLANRGLLRIETWADRSGERVALVRRHTGRDAVTGQVSWSARFVLLLHTCVSTSSSATPVTSTLRRLALSTPGHLMVDGTAGRQTFYVGMGRGRRRNHRLRHYRPCSVADLSPPSRTPARSLASCTRFSYCTSYTT